MKNALNERGKKCDPQGKNMRNNELRGPAAIEMDIIPSDTEHLFDQEALYQETMMRYHCAILEMRTKLEVLSKDLAVRYRRNPIEFIESRLKKPSSIVRKLRRNGSNITVENMIAQVSDIAGIRVLCAYIDDIYEIARMLARQQDVRIINVKDYIKNPKENGYRSLHLILEVPIFLSEQKKNMKVEVQFRTIAMDFWASLEHKLKYKKDIANPEEISEELKACAEESAALDLRMQAIRDRIEADQA